MTERIRATEQNPERLIAFAQWLIETETGERPPPGLIPTKGQAGGERQFHNCFHTWTRI
jgi:hypothetical protein